MRALSETKRALIIGSNRVTIRTGFSALRSYFSTYYPNIIFTMASMYDVQPGFLNYVFDTFNEDTIMVFSAYRNPCIITPTNRFLEQLAISNKLLIQTIMSTSYSEESHLMSDCLNGLHTYNQLTEAPWMYNSVISRIRISVFKLLYWIVNQWHSVNGWDSFRENGDYSVIAAGDVQPHVDAITGIFNKRFKEIEKALPLGLVNMVKNDTAWFIDDTVVDTADVDAISEHHDDADTTSEPSIINMRNDEASAIAADRF